jgi:DNA-binding SARP family transcriptional activator/TolB-like protein
LGPAQEALEATRTAVRFAPPDDADIDVLSFEALARSAEPNDLATAIESYHGEFLEGLAINSEPFEEWLTVERSRLASTVCDTLRRLALLRYQAGDATSAITAAQRLVSFDPIREDGHRLLMELYAAGGRRGDALRQFASCREIMQRELGVEPDGETLSLVNRIKARAVATPTIASTEPEQPTRADAQTVGSGHASPGPTVELVAEPDPVRNALPISPPPLPRNIGRRRHRGLSARYLRWGGYAAIAGALGFAIVWGPWPGRTDRRLLSEDGPSIVVMPFRDLGEAARLKLGEGIADGLGRELSQLPGAKVISSETAHAYVLKSLDSHQLARDLGVAYIVEGSVVPAPSGMRAEATLIETSHNTVASTLTAEVDDTDAGSARNNMVTGLSWPLIGAIARQEAPRASQKPTAARTANDLVWLSWSALNSNSSQDGSAEALGLLGRALSIDEKNPDALATTANILIFEALNHYEADDYQSKLSRADALLTQALTIEPWHAAARYGRCVLRRAQAVYRAAIVVCQYLADDLYRRPLAYKEIGYDYVYLGRPDQAISAFTTADHLVRRAGARWTWLLGGGWAYMQTGNYDEAIKWLRGALAMRPHAYAARVWLVAAYALTGRLPDAEVELGELHNANPELFSRDDALADMINAPGSPAFGEHMRGVIEGLEKGGFPERMIKPLLIKTLLPIRRPKTVEQTDSH